MYCSVLMGCCCGARTSSILIFCLYLVFHGLFLVFNLVILSNPEEHVDKAIRFIDTNDHRLHDSVFYNTARDLIIQASTCIIFIHVNKKFWFHFRILVNTLHFQSQSILCCQCPIFWGLGALYFSILFCYCLGSPSTVHTFYLLQVSSSI